MAADDKKNGNGSHPEGCRCMGCHGSMSGGCSCGHGGHWTFFLLRALITVLLLMVVFWFGVAVGRMSSSYERNGLMMRGYGAYPVGVYNGMGGVASSGSATSTPAAVGGVQNY